MSIAISKVFLTNEFQSKLDIDYNNTNTDVVVQLDSGEKYIASFLAYQNLESLQKENLQSGMFLSGKFFWTKNMIMIDNCSKENVQEVVNHLLDSGDFREVFRKI